MWIILEYILEKYPWISLAYRCNGVDRPYMASRKGLETGNISREQRTSTMDELRGFKIQENIRRRFQSAGSLKNPPLQPLLLIVLLALLFLRLAEATATSQTDMPSVETGLHLVWEGINFQVLRKSSGASSPGSR